MKYFRQEILAIYGNNNLIYALNLTMYVRSIELLANPALKLKHDLGIWERHQAMSLSSPLISHVKITSSFSQRMWSSFVIVLVRFITSTDVPHDKEGIPVVTGSGSLVVGCSGFLVIG